jgi:hypothetical protein
MRLLTRRTRSMPSTDRRDWICQTCFRALFHVWEESGGTILVAECMFCQTTMAIRRFTLRDAMEELDINEEVRDDQTRS